MARGDGRDEAGPVRPKRAETRRSGDEKASATNAPSRTLRGPVAQGWSGGIVRLVRAACLREEQACLTKIPRTHGLCVGAGHTEEMHTKEAQWRCRGGAVVVMEVPSAWGALHGARQG